MVLLVLATWSFGFHLIYQMFIEKQVGND